MTVYSYSRINTYFTCPSQFQHRYLLKTPSPVPEGIELFLGSRFHEAMEFLYELVPQRVPTVNEVLDQFKAQWESQWKMSLRKQEDKGFSEPLRIIQEGQTPEDYFQKGQLFLENYYHRYHPFDQDKTEGIEKKVLFDLDPERKYRMQGYIDRLGRDSDGTLWIHDYKTSSRKMGAEDARNEDQLALYQIGLLHDPRYGPKEKIKLIWHFVAFEEDQVVGERNSKEIEWLKQKYVSKIKTVESAKDYPTKPSALCPWCEYLPLCAEGKKSVEDRKKRKEEAKENKLQASAPPIKAVPVVAESPVPDAVPVAASKEAVAPAAATPKPRKRRSSLASVSPDQLPLF